MAEIKTHKYIGHNYVMPDLVAKDTGKAKYAEDYRAEGMLFAKLLLSPMPHARVTRIDASQALAMPGVKAILTADDLPSVVEGADLGEGIIASKLSERGLTMEPLDEGEPVLAVAAVDEHTAAEAIEKIQIDFEPLPFVVDPLESLRPGSANARTDGNVWVRFVGPNTSHEPLETRTAMAYWQNGKLYMHCSTQSTMRTIAAVARWAGIDRDNVVIISEYTGGGFGERPRRISTR